MNDNQLKFEFGLVSFLLRLQLLITALLNVKSISIYIQTTLHKALLIRAWSTWVLQYKKLIMYKTGMKLQTSWNSLGKIRDGEKKVKEKKMHS